MSPRLSNVTGEAREASQDNLSDCCPAPLFDQFKAEIKSCVLWVVGGSFYRATPAVSESNNGNSQNVFKFLRIFAGCKYKTINCNNLSAEDNNGVMG